LVDIVTVRIVKVLPTSDTGCESQDESPSGPSAAARLDQLVRHHRRARMTLDGGLPQ
jgi:hypothetical protein